MRVRSLHRSRSVDRGRRGRSDPSVVDRVRVSTRDSRCAGFNTETRRLRLTGRIGSSAPVLRDTWVRRSGVFTHDCRAQIGRVNPPRSPPPLPVPKELPRRHQLLQSGGSRQHITIHPTSLMSFPIPLLDGKRLRNPYCLGWASC